MNTKYDGHQRGFRSMVYNFLDKKTGSVATNKKTPNLNQVLAQEVQKPVIKETQKKKDLRQV